MNKAPIVAVRTVSKSFDDGTIQVLSNVTLDIYPGEIVALWGASGSGKTTLLHLMGGLDAADCGTIELDGLNPASEEDRLRLRREKVGFVFQLHNLIPDLSMQENCMITAVATKGDGKAYSRRFKQLSELLGIDHRKDRRIQELSGGERQRVAICRALMHSPRVILADEPTGSLDEQTGEAVFDILKETARQEGVTVVMATHERRFAEACDRIVQVRGGVAKAL
ncbi:ABC transporter ATP-binding protein [Pelagicoccus sp. SDUM812003]|uniref:ABC transporter ATP-binding protein n=1 Tax=Pelagicoccus sp. SDUM812003 TaxID=3041267 RepID=UPI00280F5FDF|nr:ABC transporter ATP-binding protein [Pelagicoccus sp. SDUM812003]MDQ8202252.1 ABC transporter ATP-binding protein [Pelagicoccus sp. SDUM812003]